MYNEIYRQSKRPTKCGLYAQIVFKCMFNNMESIPWGALKCGLYKQVVFIYRRSSEQVGLYYSGIEKQRLTGSGCSHVLSVLSYAQLRTDRDRKHCVVLYIAPVVQV